MFLFVIFFIKSQVFFGFVLEFISEVKVLQEDLLASSMIHRVFALCCLYLFRFSDEGCLEFPESCLMFPYHVFALFCEIWFIVFWRYCGFRDSFIYYGNEGVGKMYYGFFLICI